MMYFVIVYTGVSKPQHERSLGPFPTEASANEAIERDGLARAPNDGEWATVIPNPPMQSERA
jgi:hypothetical protein